MIAEFASNQRDQREWFDYDSRDRMWQVRRQIGVNPIQTVQRLRYDVSGNILCKSDLPGWGSSCASGTPDNYSYASARPHAVTTAGNRTFTYDANGNVTIDRVNGIVDRQFDYANFDKLRRIRRGSDAVEFHYGADRARTLKVESSNGVIVKRTHYVGSVEVVNTNFKCPVFSEVRCPLFIWFRESLHWGCQVAATSFGSVRGLDLPSSPALRFSLSR